ncbi:MAG: L,D-transpeptidase family protein [Methyloceanibacter sp.]|uniref:L,D-transpeptidase family protein n=1 Tax=Methyloceanibacter sp. TaxID=1965321 RepID=UPI003D9B9CAD
MLRIKYLTPEAARRAKRTAAVLTASLGVAALVATVAMSPADAKKRKADANLIEEKAPQADSGEPMTLIVSLREQRVDVYRGTTLVTSSKVSTGMRGYSTKAGVFTILEKKRMHHSNLYSGAPMPWMQRVTWSGTALHAGVVPGYPASHGCIRLPFSFAPQLYKITGVGEHVVVAQKRPTPTIIEHANLFQPAPPPEAPAMVTKQDPQRQSSLEAVPAKLGLPVILAKADVPNLATDAAPMAPAGVAEGANHAKPGAPEPTVPGYANGSSDDTRTHAINPFAGTSGATGAHALESTDEPLKERTAASPAPAAEPSLSDAKDQASNQPNAAVSKLEAPAISAKTDTASAPAQTTVDAVVTPVSVGTPALPAPVAAAVEPSAPAQPPSVIGTRLDAGMKSAATQAAEPRSQAPLRILVTRRTQRDRVIGVQNILTDMGYIERQNFDGTIGKETLGAMKAFQKANGMAETGTFNDEFVNKVYAVAGKGIPPEGHLFVRQDFGRVFDTPVSFRDPEKPLGTHVYTAMKFAPGDTHTRWMAVSLQDDDGKEALDRLQIPDDVRQKISERLTPGSSLIVADLSINAASLAKGADFVVWAKDMPAKVTSASLKSELAPQPRKNRTRAVRPNTYQNNYGNNFGFRNQRGYRRWP